VRKLVDYLCYFCGQPRPEEYKCCQACWSVREYPHAPEKYRLIKVGAKIIDIEVLKAWVRRQNAEVRMGVSSSWFGEQDAVIMTFRLIKGDEYC